MKLIGLLICFALLAYVQSISVMSIDLGTEWMKVGIVSPGVPMEIALNKESQRKTPAVVSFRDNIRTFGEDAQTVGIRFPKNAYIYLLDLLGKDINHPIVKLYQKRFPYYELVADEERGTVLFKHDDETFYSPEELVAQLIRKGKEFAEQNVRAPIKECVITVPGYFNQAERKAILQAAQLADVKVLQLMNDYMAVALNYGIFRTKDFNDTAQYIMFYDMGASSTSTTIVSLQNVKTKERGFVETHPQISIIGVGYDRTLGGLEMQIRLRDYLGRKFNEMKKTKEDVFKNPRAMSKLLKEAGRVKTVLSANTEHYAQIEGLLDEKDFRVLVTRDEFEEMNKDLFERVAYPVEQALKTAGLTMDIMSQVVLVGAGTRVPKVQEKLQSIINMDLSKNLNTDEAATMGAVYKAADLSTGFQVKKFITKDAVLFPIQVAFARETEDSTKQVRRMLFGLMNHYPQKKVITFNKHTNDFSINLNYAELDYLRQEEIDYLGMLNLTHINLSGVHEALEKNKGDNVESKGIKAHFVMDESGVLALQNVEHVFEKTVQADAEEEGTFSKLGSTISKLFSGNDEEKPVHEEAAKEPETTPPPKVENKTAEGSDANKTTTTDAKEAAPVKEKPKIVTVKEALSANEAILYIKQLSAAQMDVSLEKLRKLNAIEFEINRRASALNNLESFVIDMQTKLDDEEYAVATTQDEVDKIRAACMEVSDWLYEDGMDSDADTFEKKLDALMRLTSDLIKRVREHRERPEAIAALNQILNSSREFLTNAKNLTKSRNAEKDIFTDVEIEALEKLIGDSEEWREKMIKEQSKLKKSEPVKMTLKSVAEKIQALDREMKYLLNKIKIWRPKKVEKPVTEEKVDEKAKDKAEKKEEETVTDKPAENTTETIEEPIKEEEEVKIEKEKAEDEHTEL